VVAFNHPDPEGPEICNSCQFGKKKGSTVSLKFATDASFPAKCTNPLSPAKAFLIDRQNWSYAE
jgi:hypothetical protein